MNAPLPSSPDSPEKTPAAASVTRAMADFAVGQHHFPALARSRAADAMVDVVGCMLAGSREALARPLLATLPAFDAPLPQAPALLVGTRRFAPEGDAALYNGAIAHALDYDDTNHPAYAHPSAVLVPALLAIAPHCRATGAQMVDAYIAGFEVFGKLGRALNTQHYKRGWHATGTFGALAAAVACGRLLGLDSSQMVTALGIAASSASGLRANFGSMVKPLHAGLAARAGLQAALLAQAGHDASAVVMEHGYGYLSVFNAGIGHDPAPLLAMGRDLEILTEHGLALKPYPACGATHPGIEAALQLHAELGGEAIASVRAGVCEMAFAPLIHVMPHAPLEGKFSLHYCLAVALLEGAVGLASFTPEKIADARIRALIPRITMEVDEDIRHDGEFATRATVVTASGRRLERFVPLAMGKPERWFSVARMEQKFRDCAEPVLGLHGCTQAFDALRTLDSPAPVVGILSLLHTFTQPMETT
jgi:2-methylcitrate dehydratase PrpD